MAYSKQIWENAPSTNSPLSADRLNHMEDGIYNAYNQIKDNYTESGTDAYSCNYINNQFEPVVLYENNSGTTDAFTLNETIQNFKYIEVFYHTSDGTRYKGSSKIYVTNENITMSLVYIHYYTNMYTKSAEINLSGTSVTFMNNVQATNGSSISSGSHIKVHRVVGYR